MSTTPLPVSGTVHWRITFFSPLGVVVHHHNHLLTPATRSMAPPFSASSISAPASLTGGARNGVAADNVAHLEITAASRSETCEWLPPSGAAGSIRIAAAVLDEMQFSSFDVVQVTIDIYMPWQRLREILKADVVGIPQVGDVLSEFLL